MKWENLYNLLMEYGEIIRNKYQDNLIRNNRIASGNLLNSIDFDVNYDDRSIKLTLSLEDYWKYIEDDTKPHWPPVDKIREWIRIKPVIPHSKNGKLPTESQLTYLIGRKISIEGTKGTKDLHNAIEDTVTDFETKIQEAIAKDVSNEIDVLFTQYFR